MTDVPRLWRVIVGDDEAPARRGVCQLLAPFKDFEVVAECRNGPEILQALDVWKPDLLFLDIQMPGMDGFQVIRRASAPLPVLVLLTAHEQYALKAFEAEAIDYLLKPVSSVRFGAAIRRVSRLLEAGHGSADAVVLTTAQGTEIVPLVAIDWIEAADNYARVWVGTRGRLAREPLDALEERAKAAGFFRSHRSALVRLRCVRRLVREPDGGLFAVLSSGARVPVSRRRRVEFANAVREAARAHGQARPAP